jgi:uncharacterized protein YjdB
LEHGERMKKSIPLLCAFLTAALVGCIENTSTSPTPEIIGITLTGNNYLAVGDTTILTPTVVVKGDIAQTVTWSSSDEAIATVIDGKVTAVAPGSAMITATSIEDTSAVGTFYVAVVAPPSPTVHNVFISGKNQVEINGVIQLEAIVDGSSESAQTVTWSSSNTAVATVDANGLVTGVGVGNAIITATSVADRSKSGTLNITVTAFIPTVNSVTVSGIDSVN